MAFNESTVIIRRLALRRAAIKKTDRGWPLFKLLFCCCFVLNAKRLLSCISLIVVGAAALVAVLLVLVSPTKVEAAPDNPATRGTVMLGVDVLQQRGFDVLRGKHVGLLTNQAGVNRYGQSTIDILRNTPNVKLVALFGPEHGIDGTASANESVSTKRDPRTGLPVYSLFGSTRRPTTDMLARIDVMVIDLQDVGVRSYTYISAMRYVMEECFKRGKEVVVLDRPNPMGGLKVDGPMMDDGLMSYVGAYRVPYVYGLTIGELAMMAKGTPGWLEISEKQRISGKLTVVPMSGWRRDMRWTDTGLTWKMTSPFVQDMNAANGYAMTGLGCMLGGFHHGVGTNFPFRILDFPGKSPEQLCSALRAEHIPGLDFRVAAINANGVQNKGVYVSITDWNALRPTEISLHMMKLAAKFSRERGRPNPFARASHDQIQLFNKHMGSQEFWNSLVRDGDRVDIYAFMSKWQQQGLAFQQQSKRFWIYKQ
jgi:uncharacterized protein YbbC (DUF1343 family)